MPNPKGITTSIIAIANALACQLTNDELAYWGIILSQLGSTMGTIAALHNLLCDKKEDIGTCADSRVTEEAAVNEEHALLTAEAGIALRRPR